VAGAVVVGFEVSMWQFVAGDTDALERLDQQGDDVRGDKFVVSVWQPVAIQLPTLFVIFQTGPQLIDNGYEGFYRLC
jgi:hypothetical protein